MREKVEQMAGSRRGCREGGGGGEGDSGKVSGMCADDEPSRGIFDSNLRYPRHSHGRSSSICSGSFQSRMIPLISHKRITRATSTLGS